MSLKLYYFPISARGEASRLILAYGKVAFEDVILRGPAWADWKSKAPFGQVPVLELEDGRMLAQSGAIERYAANLAGLYPKDPVTAAYADQMNFLVGEAFDLMSTANKAPTMEEKIVNRIAMLADKMPAKFELMTKLLEKSPYAAGSEFCYADIVLFTFLCFLRAGDLDAVPITTGDDFPALMAYRKRIASLDPIKAYYANATGNRLAFQP